MHQRERELAAQCSLTLVTDADHKFHSFFQQLFHGNARWQVPTIYYDLISLPIHGLEHDAKRMQMLIENVSLAVDVHSTERVCILGHDNADSICEHLCRELQPRFPNLSLEGIPVGKYLNSLANEPSRRLVVTCIDFRLHHEAGLQGMFIEPSAWLTYPGAAFAGVDPVSEAIFYSDLDRVLDREAVDELTLVSHTDCAKYAAKYSWRKVKENN